MNVTDLLVSSSSWTPVIDAVLKSTLLLALAGTVVALLRHASAAVRHCVWTLGLSGALMLPALSLALPTWEVPVVTFAVPGAGSAATAEGIPPREKRNALAPRQEQEPRREVERPATSGRERSDLPLRTSPAPPIGKLRSDPWTLWTALFAVWLAGAIAILARLTLGLLAVQWMSRRTALVTDAPWLPLARDLAREVGIRSRLTFLRSDRATMPMAWGVVRPSVLMPADADSWPADRLRIVLLHELAHVKRRDCLTHVLSQIACAVYWFNPLVWIAARHARAERERACDDLVLAAGTRGSDYADQLLEMARARRDSRFPVLVTGATLAMAHRTQLEGRLIAILDPRIPRSRLSRAATTAATALAGCALLPLASIQPWAYAEPAATARPAATFELAETATEPPSAAQFERDFQSDTSHSAQDVSRPPRDFVKSLAAAALDAVGESAAEGIVQGAMHGAVRGALEGALGAVVSQQGVAAQRSAAAQQGEQPQQKTASQERKADPRTIAALTAALKDADVEVREAAMHALVQLRDPAIYETLVAALHDSSADIREEAAMALAELEDPRAVEPLRGALKDQSAAVREQVIFALGNLRDKEVAAAIAEALKDSSASVREQAAFALGQLGDKAYVDALAAALADSSASVREQAAFALGQLGDAKAMNALAAALADAADSVREQAVFALGQIGDPAAVDSLVKALRDAQPDIREQAAFALGQIGESRAVTALISALKDSNADVREQAAFALGQLGDRAAVEALVVAMKDASADVRSQAAFALGQLRDPRAIDALTEALKDTSADVRRQAAFALGQIHQ